MEVKITAQQLILLLIACVLYDAYASDMVRNQIEIRLNSAVIVDIFKKPEMLACESVY